MADRVRDWRAGLVTACSDLFDPTTGAMAPLGP